MIVVRSPSLVFFTALSVAGVIVPSRGPLFDRNRYPKAPPGTSKSSLGASRNRSRIPKAAHRARERESLALGEGTPPRLGADGTPRCPRPPGPRTLFYYYTIQNTYLSSTIPSRRTLSGSADLELGGWGWGHLGIPPQFGLVEGIRLSNVTFSKKLIDQFFKS